MVEDAKQEVAEETLSASDIVDNAFDAVEEESTSTESSTEEKTEETEVTETEEPSAEDEKTESSEEEEPEVPKEFHKHPAWQRIMKERDEAKNDVVELDKKYSSFESKLEEFNKVTSSPAYIKQRMEAEGYKQEAIDTKLQELGHKVETPSTTDVDLVMRELNIQKDNLTDEAKNYIDTYVADAAKVADIIIRDRLTKFKATELGDITSEIGEMSRERKATEYLTGMKELISSEGVLDFDKDIVPGMREYFKENPNASQEQAVSHFRDLSRQLTIDVLSAKGKKSATQESKKSLRGNKEGATIDPTNAPVQAEDETTSSFVDKILDWGGVKY